MGYTLRIGELIIDYDNNEDYPSIHLEANPEKHDNAPAFGEFADHENQRWPSYTTWYEFCMFTDLFDLFYGKDATSDITRDDALLNYHPGCVPLTERHRAEINEALESFKKKYPKATPTFGNIKDDFTADPNNPIENSWMCRLIWLHYWVNWALDNCKRPVFQNS